MDTVSTPLLLWIVLIPAIGALINGLGAGKISERAAGFVATLAIACSFGLAATAWYALMTNGGEDTILSFVAYRFIETGSLTIDIAFQLDRLSAIMVLVVTGVSTFIHLYSTGYMKGDRSAVRYFSHLNMFVFFMLLLVMGKNLLVMFVGWEGVGVSSYLLIGFWYEDGAKAIAGQKAFVVNRIGDFGFLLALFMLMLYNNGNVDFASLAAWAAGGSPAASDQMTITIITLLLFVGAMGKSAQLPLYVWLPDAMAGPTPVSALIHAATMVTAGVYMVARMSFLFSMAPITMAVVATVGTLTAVFAASIGLVQRDIKKVLAYSTVSQLGYMFLAVGSGAYAAGVFHLTTHAFFKACLFLGAGSVIHAMAGKQDIMEFGGLAKKMKWTRITFLISTLAIAGVPPLSGFFSKDAILFHAFGSDAAFPTLYKVLWAVGLAAAGMTGFYMMRLYWLTFQGKTRMSDHDWAHAHESPWTMTLPLVVLAIAATFAGALGIPGHDIIHHWLEPVVGAFSTPLTEHAHSMEYPLMGLSVLVAAAGLSLAWFLYRKGPVNLSKALAPAHKVLLNKYWVDELYDLLVVKPLAVGARFLNQVVDRIFIDTLAVRGSAFMVKAVGVLPRMYSNGSLYRYLAAMVFGLAAAMLLF